MFHNKTIRRGSQDVLAMVAINDRKGLATMDIVSVVTEVVKDQQRVIASQMELMEQLVKRLEALQTKLELQDKH